MPIYEITAPDGRVLEIEGEKMPSETELNDIFNTVSVNTYGKLGPTTLSATPKRTLLDDFSDCLKWVNNTRIAAYQEGKNQVEVAHLEMKDMFGRANQNELKRLDELSTLPESTHGIPEKRKYIDNNETNFIPRMADNISTGAKKGYVEALKMLPYMWETLKAGGIGTAGGSLVGGTVGLVRSVATTKADAIPSTLQGMSVGATWGGRISGSMKLAELEAGLARNELKQINREIIEQGGEPLSDAEINALSLGVGGINAGLEYVGLKQILKTVPNGNKIIEYFEKKNLRELATNATIREQLRGILPQYAKAVATEMTTEMAQEATNIVAGELSRKLGGVENTPLEQNVARILDTGKATFGATLYLGGIGSTAKVATIMTKQGVSKLQAEKAAEEMTPEQKEDFIKNNLDTLFDTINDVPEVKELENLNQLKNKVFTRNLNAGLDKEEALHEAVIESNAISSLAKSIGMDVDQVNKEFGITLESLDDTQAKLQYENDTKTLQGRVEMDVEKHNQSAMYRSPQENFEDFYNQVFEKESEAKENNTKIAKSYYQYNDDKVQVRVKHDAINHGKNRHQLTIDEWKSVLENLTNIENAGISNKKYSNDDVALIKINTPNGKYGVAIQYANGTNQISTAFKSTDKGIDAWIKKGSANSLPNNPVATLEQSSISDAVVSQNLTNIINGIKEKLNPNSGNHEVMFQSIDQSDYTKMEQTNIEQNFGDTAENLAEGIKADIENILLENNIGEDEFKLEKIRLYGSFTTGKNKKSSDLDFLVQYSGTMREDDAFNMFADEKLKITDINGKERDVDINPINVEKTGRIEEKLEQLRRLEDENQILFQSAYHGTPHKFGEFSLDSIGSGEGAQAHGWGLYFAENKEVSEGYREKLLSRKGFLNQYEISVNNEPINEQAKFYLVNNMNSSVLYNAANKENQDEFINNIKWHIDYLKRGEPSVIKLIELLQTQIDKIENNPKLSITKFLNEVPEYEKYRFQTIVNAAKLGAKRENRKATIQDVLKIVKMQLEPFANERKKQLSVLKELEKINLKNIKITTNTGQLFEVDIPEMDVLLDENKKIAEQPDNVQKAIEQYFLKTYLSNNGDISQFDYKKTLEFLGIRTGRDLYRNIAEWELSKFDKSLEGYEFKVSQIDLNNRKEKYELASKKLNSMGIKGITYDGKQDGRCYVIFDDKAINVLKTYYQGEENIENARGFTYQRKNFDGTLKDNLIVLLKNKSDKSTLIHEFAHVYLITLNRLAQNNDKARELLTTVNKWLNYNGVEYTTKQHEKFANGFVAYVRAGKAPTYGLKRAFENFKQWLNDLYMNLKYDDEIELDNDTKEVFDELLGNMSLTAKNEQVKEIIKKAKDNALLRLYEDEKNSKITQSQLTEQQKRYRDTAYDILWYALSNTKNEEGRNLIKDKGQLYMLLGSDKKVTKQNKGLKLQSEKLEEVLGELDDVFSGGNGFLPSWGEFFADPGLEDGKDAELALAAYDVIVNKKYLYDANNFEELSEKEVQLTKYELDYILDEYKNGKNKDAVLAAFFEWVDSVHPYIEEDIINEWELKSNEIDRYESLSEFQKAKEDLKLYAATLKGYGDYSTQFAEYARKILKRLDFMTEHDKAKILDKLKEYNSFREIERHLDEVLDYAETLNDVSYRRKLADSIITEVKRTTPEIIKGTKKTRYDYRTNKLFERLRYLNTLKKEEITELYDAYVNGEIERRANALKEDGTIAVKSEEFFEDIENSFIQFKANGIYYNSTEVLETLLDKIQNAKFTGKIARDEMDFQKRMNQRTWIDNCAKAVEAHRGKVGKLEELYSVEANFDSMLSMIFDDKVKEKFTLDDLYAQVDGRVGKDRQEVLDKIATVFGYTGKLKGAQLNNKFIEMVNDTAYQIKQRYANKEDTDSLGVWNWENITLSKMEVLYYYIQAKNPVSYSMLTDMGDENRAPKGQFDKFEFDELLKNLSEQEKLMGDILQIAAEKYYNELNRYHINKHHIDMGKVTCYFPRKSEQNEINELDLFNTFTEKSTNPKFAKLRSAGPSVRIAPSNPVNVLFNHIQKANTLIIMGEQLDLINKVFRDNDLRQKIKSIFGETAYKEFMQHVTENLYTGQTRTLSVAEGWIGKLMSNIIGAPIMIKPQIGFKQMMSLLNYGVGDDFVSTLEWFREFANVVKNPKKAIDYMLQDEYLKDRVSRGNLNEALRNQLENTAGAKLGILSEFFSLNMRLGDIGAIALGGKAYVDVLLKKGYTKEQAFEIFRKKTVNDQQSSISSTLSNMQRNSKNNIWSKLIFAYQNTPHQYFRTCANAFIKAKQGRMSKKQATKIIVIYWYLFPLMFNMATSLSPITLLVTGDPEELYTDLVISLLGNIACIPFFGETARAVWSTITGQEYFGKRDWFTRANQAIVKPIKKIQKDELTFEDIIKSLEVLVQGLGIPLEEIDTQIEAIGDYANGDFIQGAVKTAGYSRARADAVAGVKKKK